MKVRQMNPNQVCQSALTTQTQWNAAIDPVPHTHYRLSSQEILPKSSKVHVTLHHVALSSLSQASQGSAVPEWHHLVAYPNNWEELLLKNTPLMRGTKREK